MNAKDTKKLEGMVEKQIARVDTTYASELESVKHATDTGENTWGHDFLRGMLHLGEADVLGRFLTNRENQVHKLGLDYLRLEKEPESEARTSAMNQTIARWTRAKNEVEAVSLAFEVRKLAAEKVTGKPYAAPKQRMEAASGSAAANKANKEALAEFAHSLKQ